jgi:polyisoprenoid-binding protein YceI
MMRSRFPLASAAILIAAMALGAAAGAHAQGPMKAPGDPNPAAVQAGAYAVEPSHTRIQFSVDHLGFTTWYGDFTGAAGELTLDPKAPASSRLSVTIPTASVSTTNAKLDGELKSADWFDADKYPTIRFTATKVTPTGAERATITGDLTFHGVTRPVTLQARFHGAGMNPLAKTYTAGFDATGKISRSAFGVTKYVPIVGDEVNLTISAAFERKAS